MGEQVQVPCTRCATVVRVPAARLREGPKCPQCHHALFEGHPAAVDASAFERQLSQAVG